MNETSKEAKAKLQDRINKNSRRLGENERIDRNKSFHNVLNRSVAAAFGDDYDYE